MNIIIRKGNVSDARGIAEVNTYTWLTAYKGLIPDEILEKRKSTIDERIPRIANSIIEKDNFYVAVYDNKVVGMMDYGESRNTDYPNSGEIYSIYVLDKYQGLGLGKKLFMSGIKELIDKGFDSMILNVLDGNKAMSFYEKYHGKKVGKKRDFFGKATLNETIMFFDNLKNIYSEFNIEPHEQKMIS